MHTPQQNGVAERKNGHILEVTRSLLFQTNVPKHYWGETALTAIHLINCLPTWILGFKSPLEILSSFYPNVQLENNLIPKTFRCVAYVHNQHPGIGKLDPCALKCIFFCYSNTKKRFKCYRPTLKKFFISIDVIFNEHKPFYTTKDSLFEGEKLSKDESGNQVGNFLLLISPQEITTPTTIILETTLPEFEGSQKEIDQSPIVDETLKELLIALQKGKRTCFLNP